MKLFDTAPQALVQAVFSDMIEQYAFSIYDDAYGPVLKNDCVSLYFYANELEELTLYVTIEDITLSFNVFMQNLYGEVFSEEWDNKIDPLISAQFNGSSGIHTRALFQYKFLLQKYMLHVLNGTYFSFLPKIRDKINTFNCLWEIMIVNKIHPPWFTKGTRKYGSRRSFLELNEMLRAFLISEGIELPDGLKSN